MACGGGTSLNGTLGAWRLFYFILIYSLLPSVGQGAGHLLVPTPCLVEQHPLLYFLTEDDASSSSYACSFLCKLLTNRFLCVCVGGGYPQNAKCLHFATKVWALCALSVNTLQPKCRYFLPETYKLGFLSLCSLLIGGLLLWSKLFAIIAFGRAI